MLFKSLAGSFCVLCCSLVWAGTTDYHYYVGASAGVAFMDDKQPTPTEGDFQEGLLLGGELGFQPFAWDKFELRLRLNQGLLKLQGQSDPESATWIATDAIVFLPNDYNYLFAGSHYQKLADHSQPGYHLGAGARHPLSKRWALTGEVQALYGMDVETWDVLATVGVQYFFGEKSKPKARQADDDQDGIVNRKDICPHTPKGYSVDEKGCTLFRDAAITRQVVIHFEHNDATIPAKYFDNVKAIADFMQQHPQLDILIEGHTSLVGSAEYNKALSEDRAEAVKDLLIERYQVASSRIGTQGFGEETPVIQPEQGEEDAAKNRRIMVEMKAREKAF